MIFNLFHIATIHSTINTKTYKQAKNSFNPANTQSSSRESLKEKLPYIYWSVFSFHLVQYTNTEFMSQMT